MSVVKQGRSFSGRERHCCFLNTGETQFADVSAISGIDLEDDGRGLATTDWDNDGDLDVWISNRNGPMLRFFENATNTLSSGDFLRLRLVGTNSNRDAIGARLELRLEGEPNPIVRTLKAGEGFLSQSSKWVHFGCGSLHDFESLKVRWPSGQVDIIRDLSLNGCYELTEGNVKPRQLEVTPVKIAKSLDQSEIRKSTQRSQMFTHMPISLPRLAYESSTGNAIDISKFRGKPTLVNLWSSECKACQIEISKLDAWQEETAADVNLCVISVDRLLDPSQSETTRLLDQKAFKVGWATAALVDKVQIVSDTIYDVYEPIPVPTSLLLDSDGNLAAIYKGPVDGIRLAADIKRLPLQENARRNASVPFPGRWIAEYRKLHLIDLAFRLLEAGYEEDAIEFYSRNDRMLASHGQSARLFHDLAKVFLKRGNERKACDFLRAALQRSPNYYQAMDRLAWVLATSRDEQLFNPVKSLELAKRAGQLCSHRDPLVLDSLAAAFAANGDFGNATETARSGRELARSLGREELVETIDRRMKLYKGRKPYRQVD